MKKPLLRSPRHCSRRLAIRRPVACLASGVFAVLMCACHTATTRASDANWTGTTSNDYNINTNWSTGIVPAVPGTATFNSAGNGNTTIINATTTINRLVFDTPNAAAYTIGTSANTITLDSASAGGTVTINSPVQNSQVINSNFLLGMNVTTATPLASGSHSFSNNTNLGSGRTLTFGGSIAGIAGGTAGAEVLSLNGNGAGVLGGNISNGGAATFQVTINSGLWTLSGNNSFAGPTFTQDTVNYTRGILLGNASSFLRIGSSGALGNGVLNITNTATLQAVNGDQIVNRDIVLGNNGFNVSGSNSLTTSGRLILGGAAVVTNNVAAGKVFEIDGNVELRNNTSGTVRTLTFTGSGTSVLGGSVVNSNAALGVTSTGSIIYAGTGALVLSGANTYTGATQVTSGTLTLDYSTNVGTKISGVGTGGGLTLGGGTVNLSGGASSTTETPGALALNAGASAINQTNGSTSTITLTTLTRNAGATLALGSGGIVRTTTGTASTVLTNGAAVVGVVGGNDWAAKDAANAFIVGFSTVGTYSASTATTVTSGAQTDVGTNVTLGAAGATQTLRFNTANAFTINENGNALNLTQGGILVTPAVGNNLTTISGGTLTTSNSFVVFQNNNANGLTISSVLSGAAPFIKSGTGLATLSNTANTYTGITYLNQGTLNIAADASLGIAPAAAVANQLSMNGGTLQFGASNTTLAANRGVTLLGNGGTVDTNGTTGSSVASVIAGAGNFTKTGTGILSLNPATGPNTYTGSTTVNGGTLSLARAGTNSGTAVTAGTLAATPVTINGSGTLLLSASNTMNPASTMTLSGGTLSVGSGVLQGSAVSTAATGTTVTGLGMLTLTANSSLNFQDTAGTLVFSSFDPTNLVTGNFTLSVSGSNFGTAASSTDGTNDRLVFGQQLSTSQLAAINFNVGGTTYTATEFQLGTSAFYEIIPGAAVPEPSTWVSGILMLSLGGYGVYRRRIRRDV